MHATSPFEAFDAWLEQHLPECFADLRQGADPSQLEAFARAIGAREPPQGWIDLYRWHDGQTATVLQGGRYQRAPLVTGIWLGLEFYTLDRVLEEWQHWNVVIDSLKPDELTEFATSSTRPAPSG